ncbi:uncharacterized protein LOC128391991 [Panonychus citri]|uniref:uncharacterized protein LOC128391991 n=1 Tax=Panonychus citri TaxID=50023 RepID=UPI002307E9D5|nr:uncharacterized protein LOC128391991 [Panonychus citri]
MLNCERIAFIFNGTLIGYQVNCLPSKSQLTKFKTIKVFMLIVLIRSVLISLLSSSEKQFLSMTTINLILGDSTNCLSQHLIIKLIILLITICFTMLFISCHQPFNYKNNSNDLKLFHICNQIYSTGSLIADQINLHQPKNLLQLRLSLKLLVCYQGITLTLATGYLLFYINCSFRCHLITNQLSQLTYPTLISSTFWITINSIVAATALFSCFWFYFHIFIFILYIKLRLKELINVMRAINCTSNRQSDHFNNLQFQCLVNCNRILNDIEKANCEIRSLILTTFSSLALFTDFVLFACLIIGIDDPLIKWPILIPATITLIGINGFSKFLLIPVNSKVDELIVLLHNMSANNCCSDQNELLIIQIKLLATLDRLKVKPIGFWIGQVLRIESYCLLKVKQFKLINTFFLILIINCFVNLQIIIENSTIFLLMINAYNQVGTT